MSTTKERQLATGAGEGCLNAGLALSSPPVHCTTGGEGRQVFWWQNSAVWQAAISTPLVFLGASRDIYQEALEDIETGSVGLSEEEQHSHVAQLRDAIDRLNLALGAQKVGRS